jgi:hypothetical protein
MGLIGLATARALTPAFSLALPLTGSLILAPGGAAKAAGQAIPQAPLARKFNVFLGEDAIGHHRFTVTPGARAGDWEVAVDINLLIDLGWFGEITYVHSSRESWRGGRIVQLESRTDDDGDVCSVSGRAAGDKFRLAGPSGPVDAPGHLMTSNGTWSESICRQSRIIDATGGTVVELVAIPEGVAETGLGSPGSDGSESGGPARAYQVTCPMIAGSFWYDTAGLWMRSRLVRRGHKIDYVLAG